MRPPVPAASGGPEISPAAAAPIDSTVAEAPSTDSAHDAFLVPIDGDVFYERQIKVVATLGNAPASSVLLLDGYPESQPLALNDGVVSATLVGLKSGVHELTLLLFNERTEIIGKQMVRFFVRVPEPERKTRAGASGSSATCSASWI